jgi:putative sugar O-methyltransferase
VYSKRILSKLLIACCCLIAGCQKSEEKRLPRCIYDHPIFAQAATQAVADEQQFSQFKRNPFFNLLWENHTREEGQEWLEKITNQYTQLKIKFDLFRQIDHIGSPRTYFFEDAGNFSPSTLRLVAMTGELCARVGPVENGNIVQIGAGSGSWCKVLHDILRVKSYTIVDVPEQLALAKKCLEKWGIDNVAFYTPEELPQRIVYDLAISDMSFSEFNHFYQRLFFDRILSQSASGCIFGHIFPKHFGVACMSLEELKIRFEKASNSSFQSTNERDYIIHWKH